MDTIQTLPNQSTIRRKDGKLVPYSVFWLVALLLILLVSVGDMIWNSYNVQTVPSRMSSAFVAKSPGTVMVVPNSALTTEGGVEVVHVVLAPDQPAIAIPVKTGVRSDEQTEILSCIETGKQCLEPGDEVVIRTDEAQ